MSMTDPIADMLTRIRNACGSKHRRVDMPAVEAEDRDRADPEGEQLHPGLHDGRDRGWHGRCSASSSSTRRAASR